MLGGGGDDQMPSENRRVIQVHRDTHARAKRIAEELAESIAIITETALALLDCVPRRQQEGLIRAACQRLRRWQRTPPQEVDHGLD